MRLWDTEEMLNCRCGTVEIYSGRGGGGEGYGSAEVGTLAKESAEDIGLDF